MISSNCESPRSEWIRRAPCSHNESVVKSLKILRSGRVKSKFMQVLGLLFTMIALVAMSLGQEPTTQKTAPLSTKLPKCTDPLPTLAVPDAPHGLFAIMFPDPQKQAKTTHLLLHNQVVFACFCKPGNMIEINP